MVHCLGSLQWPVAVSMGITFVELAMDFEVFMGLSLPVVPRRGPGVWTLLLLTARRP